MESVSADRNLLFGILALQMDFISRDQMVAAMSAWTLDKSKPLGDVLCERGAIDAETRTLLDSLVEKHVESHGGAARRSLASLSWSESATRERLRAIDDDEVQATLMQLGALDDSELDDRPERNGESMAPGERYRIVRRHAQGGLGEVYVAEDAELGRNVALKIMHQRHAADLRRRARFLLEAEITGGLEHPGIVPVYGSGSYSDGRPFYAMRFVKGENLKQAIARFHATGPRFDSLAFRELLARFIDICNAVAFAHSRGVLHRDIKPSNVMLGKFGETLVVDWGLAKTQGGRERAPTQDDASRFEPRGDDRSATVMGAALGTPAYMPPEQAEGRIADLGPASDVYSLGATLYEILAGAAPFTGQATEVIDQVQRGEFVPPRLVQPAAPAALEAACLKAMALRPTQRYGSALELAEEIKHWLADEPVRAFAEPFPARVRRWMRRHRPLVASAAALLATAAIALTISLFVVNEKQKQTEFALRSEEQHRNNAERERKLADGQRQEAERQRKQADTERTKQSELADFLTTMFQASDPLGMQGFQFARMTGEQVTVRRVLDGAYDRLRRNGSAMNPVVLASLQEKLGNVYRTLAEYDRAEELLKSAFALSELHLPADHEDRINSMQSLAWLLQEKGDYETAEKLFRDVVRLRSGLPETNPNVSAAKFNLGMLLAEMDSFIEAEQLFKEVIRLRKATHGDSRELMIANFGLAAVYLEDGRQTLAVPPILESIRILKAVEKGSLAESVPLFQSGVFLSQTMGQHAAGVKKLQECIDVIRKSDLGERHLYIALVWGTLGATQLQMKDLVAAEASFAHCADILRNTVGLEHPRTSQFVRQYAKVLHDLGRTGDSEALLSELVESRVRRFGQNHRLVADAHLARALSRRDIGNAGGAEQSFRDAVQAYRVAGKLKSENGVWALTHLGWTLLKQNKSLPDAEQLLQEARSLLPGLTARDEIVFAEVPLYLADAGLRQNKSEDTIRVVLQEAQAGARRMSGTRAEELTVMIDGRLIRQAILAGRTSEAESAAVELAARRCRNRNNEFERARELCRCMSLTIRTLPAETDRSAVHDRYAAWVQSAVQSALALGFRDLAQVYRDPDLQIVSQRPEFADLMWQWADARAPR